MTSAIKYLFLVVNIALSSAVLAVDEASVIKRYLDEHSYYIERGTAEFSVEAISRLDTNAFNLQLKKYDRYSSYTDKGEFKSFVSVNSQKKAGVGMDLVYDRENRIRCIPFYSSPCDDVGIEYMDTLLKVDGKDVRNKPLELIASMVRGDNNSYVTIEVEKSDGTVRTYDIKRVDKTYKHVIKTGDNPETIRIYRFAKGVANELREELEHLTTPNDKHIFLDLRGNTGGLLTEGAACAGLFLAEGATLYIYKDKKTVEEYKATTDGMAKDRKVIILMDSLTASAAELMITAMKNSKKVATYGTVSAGKSIIQDVFTLGDGAVLKISIGELLYKDKDYGWQDKGLKPDMESN